jgi:hypothetical protein
MEERHYPNLHLQPEGKDSHSHLGSVEIDWDFFTAAARCLQQTQIGFVRAHADGFEFLAHEVSIK